MRSSILVRWRVRTILVAVASVVVGPTLSPFVAPAWAAEGDKAVARAHYETATRLYEVREYAEALKEYKAAYVAKPDPAFLFNIGQCYRKMDKNEEALDFFQQYLKKAPPDDPNRAQVEARIQNIKAGLKSAYDPFDRSSSAKPAPSQAWQPAPAAPPPAPVLAPAPAPLPSAPPVGRQPSSPVQSGPVPTPMVAPPAGVELVAAPAAPSEVQESSPFYKTWWFWTGVGAVVVAGTVTAIVLSSRGGGTDIPATTLGSKPVLP
jgi:hypothetical protein